MDRFDRQRKIFGDKGQKRLRATTVGIVGGGGLGSLMVLELAYLGNWEDRDRRRRSHSRNPTGTGWWALG